MLLHFSLAQNLHNINSSTEFNYGIFQRTQCQNTTGDVVPLYSIKWCSQSVHLHASNARFSTDYSEYVTP